MPDPPDLEEREEKSSRFFLATPPAAAGEADGLGEAEADVWGPVPPISCSVEEELWREGERCGCCAANGAGGGEEEEAEVALTIGAALDGCGGRGDSSRCRSSSKELPRSATSTKRMNDQCVCKSTIMALFKGI